MVEPRHIRLHLHLTSDEYLSYYRGESRYVVARSTDGRVIKFPASALRGFITRDGIHGEFEIEIGSDNRLNGIRQLR